MTVGMSVVLFVVLPRSVEPSRFFTPEEKRLARARFEEGTLDARAWRGGGRAGEVSLASASRSPGAANFLPSMVRRLTTDAARANLLTIGEHLTAMACQLGATFLNNRIQQRALLISSFAAVACLAWVLLATLDLSGGRAKAGYFLTYLLMAATFTPPPLVAEWIASNSPMSTGRAVQLGMFATAIPVGGIVNSVAFRAQDASVYQRGLLTCASFMALLVLLAAEMRVQFARLIEKMDRGQV
ncbi:hypothetical protein diail_9579, partial [Diaporthe ilicicola]